MKSGSAAYWFPVTVDRIAGIPKRYEGYDSTDHEDVDEWLTEALDLFTDLYGTVVDSHYMIQSVENDSEGNFGCVTVIVVTGIVDSETDFDKKVNNYWPSDLAEQIYSAAQGVDMEGIEEYNLSTIQQEPVWTKYNS